MEFEELRKNHISASQVGIVLGLNYTVYKNKRDEEIKEYTSTKASLILKKLGRIPRDEIPEKLAQRMQLGLDYEPIAFNDYAKDLPSGVKAVYQPGIKVSEKYPWLSGAPDGLVYDLQGNLVWGVEFKVAFSLIEMENYEDIDQYLQENYPLYYTQIQTYMLIFDVEFWELKFTEIGKSYLKIPALRIHRNNAFINGIIHLTKSFYDEWILPNQERDKNNEELILPFEESKPYEFFISEGVHELNESQSKILSDIMNLKAQKKELETTLKEKESFLTTQLEPIDKNTFISDLYKVKKIKVKGSKKLDLEKLCAKNKIDFDGCYTIGDESAQYRYYKRSEA